MVRAAFLPPEPDPNELTLFDPADLPPVVAAPPPEGSIEARFLAFHEANPWVLRALERLTLDLLDKGHRRIGIGMLVEVIRWQYARATVSDDGLKVNNDYRSRYARLLVERHPEWAEAFELRRLRTR